MIELTGTVINVFNSPAGVNKKGESYEARSKIQVLGEMALPQGGHQNQLIDLSVDDPAAYTSFLNERIRVSVGVMAGLGRVVTFYIRKGSKPVLA
jgi:hypothetical protein